MRPRLSDVSKGVVGGVAVVLAVIVIYLLVDNRKLFANTILNGLTLAGLYFLVASGFTLVFGLMRQVNMAHGSLYLLGAYIGWSIARATGSWFLGVAAGFISMAVAGLLLQTGIFRRMEGQDLRQTLVTIGISIVAADLMLAFWGGNTYQFEPPTWLAGTVSLFFVKYSVYRLVILGVAVLIGIALLSLIYGLLVRWRQSIWAAVAAHSLFDGIQLLVVIPGVLKLMPGGAALPGFW